MKCLTFCLLLAFATSCTFSITIVHTQGSAADVVDEQQKSDADFTADLPAL
jgi:hypothetical protein